MFKKYDAYIVGYYGMQNSGDDALMQASILGAQKLLGLNTLKIDTQVPVSKGQNDGISIAKKNAFRGHQRIQHYQSALQSKRIIFGGGSVLHSETDINLKRHMMRLSSRKNSMAIGVGIGPFADGAAEHACHQFLNECGFIGVRDQKSYDLAKLLSPKANVHLTFDLAPLLLLDDTHKVVPIKRKGLVFNFCQLAIDAFGNTCVQQEKQLIESALQTLVYTWQLSHEPMTLIDLNGHPTLGDQHIHKAIINQLPSDIPIEHIAYDANPFRVLQRLRGYKAAACMRLHGSILAYLGDTPTLSFNYHSKCNNWCEQIGLSASYRIDAKGFTPLNVALNIHKGLNEGFIAPQLAITQALKYTLLNWSSDDEQHSIFCRNTALQQA